MGAEIFVVCLEVRMARKGKCADQHDLAVHSWWDGFAVPHRSRTR